MLPQGLGVATSPPTQQEPSPRSAQRQAQPGSGRRPTSFPVLPAFKWDAPPRVVSRRGVGRNTQRRGAFPPLGGGQFFTNQIFFCLVFPPRYVKKDPPA